MKRIMIAMVAISIYAGLEEWGYPAIGLICGTAASVMVQYLLKNVSTNISKGGCVRWLKLKQTANTSGKMTKPGVSAARF